MSFEHCCECDAHTGRAGRGEDSLYAGSRGPYCEECYGELPEKLAEECDDKDYRIERLEAKLAAAEADAARYRWIRERASKNMAYDYEPGTMWAICSFYSEDADLSFDAAIDAARGEGDAHGGDRHHD